MTKKDRIRLERELIDAIEHLPVAGSDSLLEIAEVLDRLNWLLADTNARVGSLEASAKKKIQAR